MPRNYGIVSDIATKACVPTIVHLGTCNKKRSNRSNRGGGGGGVIFDVFVFTDRENNPFQIKIVQNMNIHEY